MGDRGGGAGAPRVAVPQDRVFCGAHLAVDDPGLRPRVGAGDPRLVARPPRRGEALVLGHEGEEGRPREGAARAVSQVHQDEAKVLEGDLVLANVEGNDLGGHRRLQAARAGAVAVAQVDAGVLAGPAVRVVGGWSVRDTSVVR